MVRVRLRPDVTDADGSWQCEAGDRQSRRRLGATPAYARTRNYDVTYAYSLYATLALASDTSPLGAGSIGGSTSNSRRK